VSWYKSTRTDAGAGTKVQILTPELLADAEMTGVRRRLNHTARTTVQILTQELLQKYKYCCFTAALLSRGYDVRAPLLYCCFTAALLLLY
jgi:hypothetical protein